MNPWYNYCRQTLPSCAWYNHNFDVALFRNQARNVCIVVHVIYCMRCVLAWYNWNTTSFPCDRYCEFSAYVSKQLICKYILQTYHRSSDTEPRSHSTPESTEDRQQLAQKLKKQLQELRDERLCKVCLSFFYSLCFYLHRYISSRHRKNLIWKLCAVAKQRNQKKLRFFVFWKKHRKV